MAPGPPGPWSIEPAPADQGERRDAYESLYVDEFGPLLAAWARVPNPPCGFDEAFPWQVAAVLRVGPYAPPEEPVVPRGPTPQGRRRVASRRAPPHPRSQADLIRARLAHAADPENYPAPEIIGSGVAGLEGLGIGPIERPG